jgi:monovalent cation:proton antiporter-2 (CPA2) family protein
MIIFAAALHLDSFLAQAFVYLLASVVSVPMAKRLGLGSVLGYLLAGAVIGPWVLGFVGSEGGDVMHFAEFGVVMMMFVIGLELKPSLLWRLRGPIIGMGGAQVAATAALVTVASLALRFPWQQSLAMGLILAMSSTAIVLQSLAERGQLKSEAGKSAFAVLLFQDIAVIPILATLPLLAMQGAAMPLEHGAVHREGWQQALLTLGAVAVIIAGGRYLVKPLFRYIAGTKLREIFTVTALMLVVGIALLMQSVGLSPALGTFLAGVVLADSEYRHELESDIEPFKGLLLGIFFIAVGAGLDFGLVFAEPAMIFAGVAGLFALKMLVLFVLARVAKLPAQDTSLFTLALSQGGEFCFVLLSFALNGNVLPMTITKPLTAIVALSMSATPLLLLLHEKVLLPRLVKKTAPREMDEIPDEETPVIIAGFGRFGIMIGRMMRSAGIKATVLDLDSDQVDFLRRIGINLFYGDASRLDLLQAAGASRARLLVLAIDDKEKALEIIDTVQKHFPKLTILARANDRIHAYEMLERGVQHIYRETLGASLDMATQVLRLLGYPAHEAQRATRTLRDLDEASVRHMAEVWKEHRDGQGYIKAAREQIEEMDRLFRADASGGFQYDDLAWDSESLRKEATGKGSGADLV